MLHAVGHVTTSVWPVSRYRRYRYGVAPEGLHRSDLQISVISVQVNLGVERVENGLVQPPALKMIPAPGRPHEPPTLGRHKLTARCHRIAERSTSSSWRCRTWNGLGMPWVPYGALGFLMACVEDGCRGVAWWCGVVLGTVVHVTVSGIWCYEMSFMPCNAVFVCVVHAWVVSVMMCNVSWQWNKHAAKRGKSWLKIHTGSWHERKPSKFELICMWFDFLCSLDVVIFYTRWNMWKPCGTLKWTRLCAL